MTIDRITLTHVRIPLLEPFRISNGMVAEKDGIIVRVYADGLIGCGEASPMAGSFYSADTPDSVWDALIASAVPAVFQGRPDDVKEVNAILRRWGGSPFARAGIETAFMELEALRSGKPVYALLGGTRNPVAAGLAVGIYDSIPSLLRSIEHHMREGYKRLKIKVQPGWDLEPLRAIRKQFGSIPLMVDANCAYTRNDIDHLRAFDEFGLMMVEQPLPREDLDGHALLQDVLTTPVCLDESAETIDQVRDAIAKESCRIINIKIQRVGGFEHALAVHDLCRSHGIPVWLGTMPELGIGSAQTLHMATMSNATFPTDVESTARWFVHDIIDPPIIVTDGLITIPGGTGNCYSINQEALKKFTVREEEIVGPRVTA
jgi:o-succinylbenzoate synthase